MDIEERNKRLCSEYRSGKTLQQISDEYGISKTQLSRIFRKNGAKRPRFELDKEYFENNSDKSMRQMSEETGISIKRVRHIKRMLFVGPKKNDDKSINFDGCEPLVDQELINDKEWLYDQYVVEHHGAPTIARKLGVNSSVVYKAFEKFGIQRRSVADMMEHLRKRPSKEWLIENYVNNGWSIDRCAVEFGTNWDSIYTALNHFGICTRSPSEQHEGELNYFFGKSHPEEIKNACRKIGAKYGSEYWSTGDVDAKIEIAKIKAKEIWSDPEKRSEASKKIMELCKCGKCNSKSELCECRDGSFILVKSSWESLVAKILDNCDAVDDWKYESVSIEYMDGDVVRNFIVDFWVKWKDGLETLVECKNQHLLANEKEQLKIEALAEYCKKHNHSYILVDSKEEVKKLTRGYKSMVEWVNDTRYKVHRKYLEEPKLFVEIMLHEIIDNICPWKPFKYELDELAKDINRLKNENLDAYTKNGLKLNVANSGGMPGKPLMLNFNPHFWEVVTNGAKPFPRAFDDRDIIYRCLGISYSENESLSAERLLREINFHYSGYGRTSFFAPGFARTVIKLMGMSGKRVFDPCCGWGGRLIGSWLEGCNYSGCDISPLTYNGLIGISEFIGYKCDIRNASCVEVDWPEFDLIFTSPPFYDIEHYVGGDQPWDRYNSRDEWISGFVEPFIGKVNSKCVLYLDEKTKDDFEQVKKFDEIIRVKNRRHARHKSGFELLCVYVA